MSLEKSSRPRLILKKGKERPLLQRHHWIYSGAIGSLPVSEEGDLIEVVASSGEKIGLAFLNRGHSIAGHMIAFGEETLEESLRTCLTQAAALRQTLFDLKRTNAFRLINAEGDGIPGLIVDSYAGVLVMQIAHPGIERIKPLLVSLLIEIFQPLSLYEKSTSFLRKKEGMGEIRGLHYGSDTPEVEMLENGRRFAVDVLDGQKTGFFLDQREMREAVFHLSLNRRVLNCFSYTGGFSIAALAGGASYVDSVESSRLCEKKVEKNLTLNNLPHDQHRFHQTDVFDFLKTTDWNYDLVILDPPAFAKKRDDVPTAFRAYKEMNRHAMEKMLPGSLLLTCSCSYHIEESLFQNILFRAALEAKRKVRILSRHRLAPDHPISLFHPETSYLKSFLLALV